MIVRVIPKGIQYFLYFGFLGNDLDSLSKYKSSGDFDDCEGQWIGVVGFVTLVMQLKEG